MHRVNYQNQYGTGNCSKVRAEERDNVSHTHDYADQRGVRCLQQRCTDKTQTSDNNGIHNFTADKSDESSMGESEALNQTIRRFFLKKSIRCFLAST